MLTVLSSTSLDETLEEMLNQKAGAAFYILKLKSDLFPRVITGNKSKVSELLCLLRLLPLNPLLCMFKSTVTCLEIKWLRSCEPAAESSKAEAPRPHLGPGSWKRARHCRFSPCNFPSAVRRLGHES